MTSRSHKKHQITPQNIRRGSVSKFFVYTISALSVCLCAAFLANVLVAQENSENPLDRLKNRSTEKRWKSIRERISDRRELRRDRLEKKIANSKKLDKKSKENEEIAQKENSSQKKSLLLGTPSATSPVTVEKVPSKLPGITPFGSNTFQKSPSWKPLANDSKSTERKKAPSERILPVIEPAPMFDATQLSNNNSIQTLPISSTKNTTRMKAIFAPEMPGNRPLHTPFEAKGTSKVFLQAAIPKETTNHAAPQRLQSTFDKIKSINTISPFADYEPNQKLREEDPGRHLCLLDALPSNTNVRCPAIETLAGNDESLSRNFAHLDFNWKATNTHSNPLYFEDPNLERYGHIHGRWIQPAVSVGRFNIQLLGLPYQMAMQPASKCVYPLGHFRPGDACTPKYYHKVPLNPWAALVTAEVYTGLFFIIP